MDSTGNVLGSFTITFTASGLTWDGASLWFADQTNKKLVQMTPFGQTISTLPVYYWHNNGVAWDGTHFWVPDYNASKIYRHLPDGALVRSFDMPSGSGVEHPTGIVFDGEALWVGDPNEGFENNVARVSVEGVLLDTFDTTSLSINPTTWPEFKALAWDGRYLWYSADDLFTVYQLDLGLP